MNEYHYMHKLQLYKMREQYLPNLTVLAENMERKVVFQYFVTIMKQ